MHSFYASFVNSRLHSFTQSFKYISDANTATTLRHNHVISPAEDVSVHLQQRQQHLHSPANTCHAETRAGSSEDRARRGTSNSSVY